MNLLIISTGGTINKLYNELNGELEIGESVAKNIYSLARGNLSTKEVSIINKDSLDMTDEDRALLADTVKNAKEENIIILHGTDTMDKSAEILAKTVADKKIVFVGAMKPYSIEKDEAIFNFASAVGFLRANPPDGIYISMHSLVLPHDEIYKDRDAGIFKPLK
ncbi:MAG: asparaginase [Campylobacteraceae bacterium]|jgi:L-asparaginase|nr:asparaginase [Campylobacteraceae bacterium]